MLYHGMTETVIWSSQDEIDDQNDEGVPFRY